MQYRPQLAQLVKKAPDGPEWVHELKYDGYRIGCRIERGRVALISRNGRDWTAAFPEIVTAAARLRTPRALLDGELCAVLPDGRTSFQALQNAASGTPHRSLVYFVFDLLLLGERDLTREPLERRKTALAALVGTRQTGRIRYAEHIEGRGPDAFAQACRLGLEGIVSKRREQPYLLGKRGGWLKTKCVRRQEFVVGGFTDPEGARAGIGALLVGFYDHDRLVFAGKVGTGFTHAGARDLRSQLERLETAVCPYATPPAGWLGRHAHWVRPRLVAEVAFTEWTSGGHIRHPSFQGLRADKAARDVVREDAAPAPVARDTPDPEPVVCGVRISHPDRVMYPEPRLTKLDVARYYERVAAWMLPHVLGRPLTLVRCGQGIDGGCVFMKHSKVWAPAALRRVRIQEKTKVGDYLVIESPEALLSLIQMDVLEIHTWNTRADRVDMPDRLVFDLDPGERIAWRTVIESARLVREVLRAIDLESFVKTTGGRGLHVVVPIERRHDWRVCLAFARTLASTLVRRDPSLFTTEFAKRGREARILIDYLRNNRTNTSIAAFSTRARPGAPVSIPIRWTDLTAAMTPDRWTVESVPGRFAKRADPWAAYWKTRQRLSASAIASVRQLA
ncbi:MAG TPA: DNA ligase D [Vicinamibacterales bacterium]|nr:DNA ligase D [Vicinamibacterales bacterium]